MLIAPVYYCQQSSLQKETHPETTIPITGRACMSKHGFSSTKFWPQLLFVHFVTQSSEKELNTSELRILHLSRVETLTDSQCYWLDS